MISMVCLQNRAKQHLIDETDFDLDFKMTLTVKILNVLLLIGRIDLNLTEHRQN